MNRKSALKFLILIFFIFFLNSNHLFAEDALKIGQEYLKKENYLQARDFFKRYTEDPKLAPEALLGFAKAEYFMGNYYEATVPLRRLIRDFSNSPQANEGYLYMGLALRKIGRLKDAEFYLNKVQPPFDKQAMIGKAWIALSRGDLKAVETAINRLENKDFNDPETALLRIKYLALSGRAEEALREFNKNLKLRKPAYEIDKAEVMIKAGKFDEAEKLIKGFIDKSKSLADTVKAKRMLFDIYLMQKKEQEALQIGKEIYFYIPTDEFRLKLYEAYLNQKNYEEALKMLFVLRDKSLKNKKMEEFIRKITSESPSNAYTYILKIYPFLPNDSQILLQSAQFLIEQGKLNEAKNILRKVQTGPRKAEAIIPLASILIKEGKYKEAKKLIEGIKDRNDNALALYGIILDKEGEKLQALQTLRKAVKSVQEPEALLALGNLEYSHGDKKKAFDYWIQAANKGIAEGAVNAADYLYMSGKIKEAASYYKKAIDLGIKDNNTQLWAYYQYGKITKDKSYLEKVAGSKGELAESARALLEKL
ncbi:tetratricopeptide repeat protein [Thermodesulfovibrio sp.]|jgi:tetratricopeptide (TPR) repeat protein|uniref:tetratricopeptide repeat protein n=2 Tax=Thermodesulfovibrionaceae TaxID=2811504 RepID=UPI00309B0D64